MLEILNLQGTIKGLRLVSRSLRCVQICASVVESIAVVNAPCLDRLILWEVRGYPNPTSGLRTRIKIGIAPKLRILGYLDPAQHLLEIGGTVIMVLLQFYYLLSFHFAHFTTIWNSMCDQSC